MSRVLAALMVMAFGLSAGFGALGVMAADTPAKAPARQVPVEPLEEPVKEAAETPAGMAKPDQAGKPSQAGAEKKPRGDAARKPETKPAHASSGRPGAVQDEKHKTARDTEMNAPGLPVRKPRKPIVRKKTEPKKARKRQAPVYDRAHDKKLCKALQSCRNTFIKCTGKIKHPDQSEAWSIAKEECGASYKACVEKDFQPGEWFFTRWFYFQELNCK